MTVGGDEYTRTRDAWQDIWHRAQLDVELATRHYARSREIRDRFLAHLPAGEWLLEAGCGLGVEMVSLRERGLRVVGVDYALDALRRLRTHDPSMAVAGADIHALPFASGVFGGYLSFGVLEHFRFGPLPALREANRVLRPGGTLVLTVPAPNLVWRLVRLRRRLRGLVDPPPGEYFETTYAATVLAGFVRETGFELIECAPFGHAFTLWGLGGPFRAEGHYQTSALADAAGAVLARLAPWSMSFTTLVIARKARA